jgi:hypothetical protein
MKWKVVFTAAMLMSVAAPALAHHSFAMFDADKTVVLKGTVREFEWQNPHVWLEMNVIDPATGKPVKYSLEMGSVARSTYDGWKKDTVRPGDPITATMHPLKDGSRGGMYLAVELPNGQKFGRTGPAVGKPTARLPGQTGGPPLD